MEGIIIKNISNDYLVKSDYDTYLCKARGKFRKMGLIPLVGDRVIFDEKEKYLLEILPRRNFLIRPSVSNVDQAIVVCSVKRPELDTYLLDKLLTIISYYGIEPVICFTKLDLLNDDEFERVNQYVDYYKKVGYVVVLNSEQDSIIRLLKGKITVLAGQSGAGKSSLINRLDSSLKLKTDDISLALNRGKHTTRHTELYDIAGGYLVDTPGFSDVDFFDMSKVDIRDNMREMFEGLHHCKYRDCMHVKEDGCYVKSMVSRGEIIESRYSNYCSFIKEV